MNAYPLDLRLKVLNVVARGIPRREVVRTFGVSLPTLERYPRRRRQTGELAPGPPQEGRQRQRRAQQNRKNPSRRTS